MIHCQESRSIYVILFIFEKKLIFTILEELLVIYQEVPLNVSKYFRMFNDISLTLGSFLRVTAIIRRFVVGYLIFELILFNYSCDREWIRILVSKRAVKLSRILSSNLTIVYLTSGFSRIATAIIEKSVIKNFDSSPNILLLLLLS